MAATDSSDAEVPFEHKLRQARESLEEVSSGRHGEGQGPVPEASELRGEGEAAEGRVRAVAVTGGRIASLELDPRVMRSSPEELGAQLAEALTAALDDLR
ncbi:hypothetical protein ACFQ07_12030, partial [Actinomadura adrarensis]